MADVTISELTQGTPDSNAVLPYSDGSTTLKATVGQIGVPVGTIVMWNNRNGASIPTNWALCDGTNGTPDLRDRFVVGYSSTKAINTTGGSADAIVVSHTHTATSTVTDPGHAHSYNIRHMSGVAGSGGTSPINNAPSTATTSSNTTGITVSTTINSQGSSGTNANLPPYYALAFIQKIS